MAVGWRMGVGVGIGVAVGRGASSGVAAGTSTVTVTISVVVQATAPRSASAAIPTMNRRQLIFDLFSNIRVDSHDQKLRAGAAQNDDSITV